MTIPFWCLLAASLLPYLWSTTSAVFRFKQFGTIDNHHPRLQQAKLEGMGARATAASANAFEALAIFAPAVLVAHVSHADPVVATRLSVGWLVLRVAHGLAYVFDIDKLRSALFTIALGCAVGLYYLAAVA